MRRGLGLALIVGFAAGGCGSFKKPTAPPPPPPPEATPTPTPSPEELEPLPVKKVEEEIVVAAWAEPKHLPEGGGQALILVRVQKRGGKPFPDVEVRLAASPGTLYSKSEILKTDARGLTRDRLTTRQTSTITLNAGGTRYTFKLSVGEPPALPTPNP